MELGAVIIAFSIVLGVKVVVMVLGARIVLKLYQSAYQEPPRRLWLLLPESDLPEVRLLWWSLVLFFFSELVCGVEVYILMRSSAIIAGLHSIVSAAGMGLFASGAYLFIDKKLIRYGGSGCVVNRLCRGCTIDEAAGCKFNFTMLLISTFALLAAAGALFVPTDALYADTRRYILPFESLNSWFDAVIVPWVKSRYPGSAQSGHAYYLPESMMLIEFRVVPLIAAVLTVAGIAAMKARREVLGLKFLMPAAGLLCYTYLEIMLYPAIGEALIGSLGHEVVELWFLIITAELLRRSFPPENALRPDTNI